MSETKENQIIIEEGFVRKPDEPKTRNWQRICKVCGREFFSVRKDSQFCSTYCRARYWRTKYSNQDKKTAPEAQKEPKKTIIGTYIASDYWWTRDKKDILKLRTWLKDNLGIGRTKTTSYKKTVDELEKVSTDSVKYQLIKTKKRNYWPSFTLYKIEQ